MNLFFDTSALVKYFHRENGSDEVERLIENTRNTIWISELSRIEFLSALHKKYRTKEINATQLSNAIAGFEEELVRFRIQTLNSVVVSEAELLIKKYGRSHSLRTLDSIQLAVFSLLAERNWKFVLADANLHQVIIKCGFQAIGV